MKPKVLNARDVGMYSGAGIYVGRGSNWGNPFILHSHKERNYVCDMYEQYAKWRLKAEPNWLIPLEGQSLVCHCSPERCHAETLMRLANK